MICDSVPAEYGRPLLFVGALVTAATVWSATVSATTIVKQEPPAGQLRYGQRLLVDDGSCPAGQLKELVGGKSSGHGVKRLRRCVHR